MAKKKSTVQIDVMVNGKMQKATVEANKLQGALAGLGRTAGEADRRVKGAAQATSNSSKEFAKMSQGMGGFVGIYATIAANVFAVSSAFEFFKSVADFRVIQDSQVAFASSTGIALRTLTGDIREAADGMLTFQEASSAAAIGSASGLSGSQLKDLAEGAASVSKVLGRDVTDSFNRLVRGVTKAEPELLDELGITLRLEEATEKYAIALGKSAKELSIFERKQAVLAEVQEQLDQKFIATTTAIDIQENAVAKLAIAFSDVMNSLKEFLAGPVEGLATFFTENIQSLIAAMGLFAAGVVRMFIGPLSNFADAARDAAQTAKMEFEDAAKTYDKYKDIKTPQDGVRSALKDSGSKSKGVQAILAGEDPTKRQAAALLRAAENNNGVVKNMTKYQQAVYTQSLKKILGRHITTMEKIKRAFFGVGDAWKRGTGRMVVVWKGAMYQVQRFAAFASRAVDKMFKFAGIIGIILLIKDLVLFILDKFFGINFDEAAEVTQFAEKFKTAKERVEDLNTEFGKLNIATEKFMENFKDVGGTPIAAIQKLGNAASSIIPGLSEINDLFKSYNSIAQKGFGGNMASIAAGTGMEDIARGLGDAFSALPTPEKMQELGAEGQKLALQLADSFHKAGIDTKSGTQAMNTFMDMLEHMATQGFGGVSADVLEEMAENFENLSARAQTFLETQTQINREFSKFMNSYGLMQTSTTNLQNTIAKQLADFVNKDNPLGSLEGISKGTGSKALDDLKSQFAILEAISITEVKRQKDLVNLRVKYNRLLKHATPLMRERIGQQQTLADLESKISESQLQLAAAIVRQKERGDVDQNKLDLLKAQTAEMMLQRDFLKDQLDYNNQIMQTIRDSFESSLSGGLADLIKGEETSLKDAIAGLAESVLKAVADKFANVIAGEISNALFKQEEEDPAETMRTAIEQASATGAQLYKDALAEGTAKVEALLEELRAKPAGEMGATGTIDPGTQLQSINTALDMVINESGRVKVTTMADEQGMNVTVDPITGEKRIRLPELNKSFENTGNEEVTDSNIKVKKASDENTDSTISNTLAVNALERSIRMGVSGSDGRSIAASVASSLASTWIGGLTASKGGVFEGYAAGGIAKGKKSGYPVMLHGTEAVVPLPDGKRIPVELAGNANNQQNNNVSVNVVVNQDGTTETEQNGEAAGANFGKAIATAVQEELRVQKRAGGMLSPYGAA